MTYPSYLIHFNRQHDKKTGKFTYGDGDGDGVINDHGHPKDNKNSGDNKNTKSVITSSSDKSGKNFIERKPGGNTYRFKDTTGKETVYRPEHDTFKERDVISGKQTTIGSDRYNSIKPRLNRDFTREGTGQYGKVGNIVKGDRGQSSDYHKPEDRSYGGDRSASRNYSDSIHKPGTGLPSNRPRTETSTRVKPTYTKYQEDSKYKPTYDKNPTGPSRYKPTYDKVGTPKGGNKVSETLSNMNATLSKNFTRVNEKSHITGSSGYDFNAPQSNGSAKYTAEQRLNSNTLDDARYYMDGNKITNPNEGGKKLVDSARDREVDDQKVTNKEGVEIVIMRALGHTLHDLYIDDSTRSGFEEKRQKNKDLLEITNTKNWNKG